MKTKHCYFISFTVTAMLFFFTQISRSQNTFPSAGSAGIGTTIHAWLLKGNQGTDSADFIGTTDAHALLFRVNNQKAGQIDFATAANTSFGYLSLASNTTGGANTAIGYHALFKNTTASNSVAIGDRALFNNGYGATENYQANGNIAVGTKALYHNTIGFSNVAVGSGALLKNTTGNNLVAIGDHALYNNGNGATQYYQARGNTAVGSKALYANSTGNSNTANGFAALYSNDTGYYNTANGYEALSLNTIGFENTANGMQSLYSNSTGNNNTANGFAALYFNTAGYLNTANGDDALYTNTTGHLNTANGGAALYSNTTGSYNTALGVSADVNADNYSNTTMIGANATGTASNQVRIGNSAVTSIGGYKEWTNISDRRVKKNIKADVPGLAFINLLKPVTYNLDLDAADKIVQRPEIKNEDGKIIQPLQEDITARQAQQQVVCTGFIAQDVEASAKKIGYDFDGVDAAKNNKDLYGLRYAEFVVPLVKAVQELSQRNDELKSKVEKLEQTIAANQQRSMNGMVKITAQLNITSLLGQNIPNPFDNSTIIPFRIPQGCKDATIIITQSSGGKIVRAIPVSCGETQISLDAGTLASGTYIYSLYVDGKLIGSKQMILGK